MYPLAPENVFDQTSLLHAHGNYSVSSHFILFFQGNCDNISDYVKIKIINLTAIEPTPHLLCILLRHGMLLVIFSECEVRCI